MTRIVIRCEQCGSAIDYPDLHEVGDCVQVLHQRIQDLENRYDKLVESVAVLARQWARLP